MESKALIRIGRIGKTFGTQGEVIIDTIQGQAINESEPVFLAMEGTRVPFFLTSLKERPDGRYVAGLDGITSPEQAQHILNLEVFIEENADTAEGEGRILITELIGFTAIDEHYGPLGIVADILEYPQQDMLVIRSSTAELLIPLVEEYIVSLDIETRELRLNTPEGLIDLLRENA